ncbi:MAG: adenylate kinase [Bacteroidales bacterium]|nr:adenylate kinase [Bacteroidales bacterium]
MLNVIICGAPGCGKGTQSAMIVEKYKLKHISTGELLRKEIAGKTDLGVVIESYISRGNLVPDQMIIEILMKAFNSETENGHGIILDGFPRTVAQAEILESVLKGTDKETTVLLDIHVDNRELISRLLKRGETSGRSDDNLETIKKRLNVFETKTAPVNYYYKTLGKYVAIDGMGTENEVFDRITAVLDSKIENQKHPVTIL